MGSLYDWLLESGYVAAWIFFLVLFYIALVAGNVAYYVMPEELRERLALSIREYFESRILQVGPNPLLLFIVIFVNNALVTIITWLLSITIIVPVLVVAINGLLIGFFIPLLFDLRIGDVSYLYLFLTVAPHGVIEIPAITLAASVFTLVFFRGFKGFLSALPGVLLLAIIMILVAAVVESTVSLLLGLLSQLVVRVVF